MIINYKGKIYNLKQNETEGQHCSFKYWCSLFEIGVVFESLRKC